eukprot:gene13976-18745_t
MSINVSTDSLTSMPPKSKVMDPTYQLHLMIVFASIIIAWLILELCFYLLLRFVVSPRLQPRRKPQPYEVEPYTFMLRILECLESLKSYSVEDFIQGFHCKADLSDIRYANFFSFLSWAMFAKHSHDLTEHESIKINHIINECKKRGYKNLPCLEGCDSNGPNPDVKHVAMTLETIPYIHRPLIMYVGVRVMEMFTEIMFLACCGFIKFEMKGISYWFKVGQTNNADPLVFMHGITTGWSVYLSLVKALGTNRTIILIDLDGIKINSMVFSLPTPNQFADAVKSILDKHGIQKVSLVGHSFGSITSGWFIRRHPDMVSHLSLIDPVSLLLALPDVAYSFLYRKPVGFTEWLIHLGASREFTISHMLHRNFWWYNNILWLEDIPNHIGVVVALAGGDEITNPTTIFEYVSLCRQKRIHFQQESKQSSIAAIECSLWPGYSHAQILFPGKSQNTLIQMIKVNEKKSSFAKPAFEN